MATSYYLFLLSADEDELHPPYYPWSHSGVIDSLDHSRYPTVLSPILVHFFYMHEKACLNRVLSAVYRHLLILAILTTALSMLGPLKYVILL